MTASICSIISLWRSRAVAALIVTHSTGVRGTYPSLVLREGRTLSVTLAKGPLPTRPYITWLGWHWHCWLGSRLGDTSALGHQVQRRSSTSDRSAFSIPNVARVNVQATSAHEQRRRQRLPRLGAAFVTWTFASPSRGFDKLSSSPLSGAAIGDTQAITSGLSQRMDELHLNSSGLTFLPDILGSLRRSVDLGSRACID